MFDERGGMSMAVLANNDIDYFFLERTIFLNSIHNHIEIGDLLTIK